MQVLLARLDMMRRTMHPAEQSARAQLTDAFAAATQLMASYFPEYVDNEMRLPMYWAQCEAQVNGDTAAAREVWRATLKVPALAKQWLAHQAYVAWEAAAGDAEHARAHFKSIASRKFVEAGGDVACERAWLRFEREHGTAVSLFAAKKRCLRAATEVRSFQHAGGRIRPGAGLTLERALTLTLWRATVHAVSALLRSKAGGQGRGCVGLGKTTNPCANQRLPAAAISPSWRDGFMPSWISEACWRRGVQAEAPPTTGARGSARGAATAGKGRRGLGFGEPPASKRAKVEKTAAEAAGGGPPPAEAQPEQAAAPRPRAKPPIVFMKHLPLDVTADQIKSEVLTGIEVRSALTRHVCTAGAHRAPVSSRSTHPECARARARDCCIQASNDRTPVMREPCAAPHWAAHQQRALTRACPLCPHGAEAGVCERELPSVACGESGQRALQTRRSPPLMRARAFAGNSRCAHRNQRGRRRQRLCVRGDGGHRWPRGGRREERHAVLR